MHGLLSKIIDVNTLEFDHALIVTFSKQDINQILKFIRHKLTKSLKRIFYEKWKTKKKELMLPIVRSQVKIHEIYKRPQTEFSFVNGCDTHDYLEALGDLICSKRMLKQEYKKFIVDKNTFFMSYNQRKKEYDRDIVKQLFAIEKREKEKADAEKRYKMEWEKRKLEEKKRKEKERLEKEAREREEAAKKEQERRRKEEEKWERYWQEQERQRRREEEESERRWKQRQHRYYGNFYDFEDDFSGFYNNFFGGGMRPKPFDYSNHYKNLDLDPNKKHTKETIRKAYLAKSKIVHPDKNHTKTAGDEFKKLNESYEKLINSL